MKFFSSTHYTPQQLQNIAIDLFCDILGSILSAIGIYTFAKLASFAPGGISGVALILNHLWNLPIGTTSLVINIPLILLSCRIEKLWHRREKKSRQADCVIFYEKFMEFLLYFCR